VARGHVDGQDAPVEGDDVRRPPDELDVRAQAPVASTPERERILDRIVGHQPDEASLV
jgi:hypothetical protein